MYKKSLHILLILVTSFSMLQAHEGEDHGIKLPELPKQERFVLDATTEHFEVVLKYQPIAPGQETSLTLFLTDYNTNRPIGNAEIQIEFPETPEIIAKASSDGAPGIYGIVATFPQEKNYAPLLTINTKKNVDVVPLGHIEVGTTLNHSHAEENTNGMFWQISGAVLLALITGLSGYSVGKRKSMV